MDNLANYILLGVLFIGWLFAMNDLLRNGNWQNNWEDGDFD